MGKDVHRYQPAIANNVVIFPYSIINNKAVLMTQDEIKTNFSLGWNYLIENKKELESREHGKFSENW